MYYYYGGKEKKAGEVKKDQTQITPYQFGDMQRDFDRMIDRFQRDFENFWDRPNWRHEMRRMMPFGEAKVLSVDLEDQGKEYRLTVDLPGFKKEDVDIDVMEDSWPFTRKNCRVKKKKPKIMCGENEQPKPIIEESLSLNRCVPTTLLQP